MKALAITFAAMALAACGTTNTPAPEARIVTQVVRVQVPTPCNVEEPAQPAYPDTAAALRAVPDVDRGTRLLLAGRELRTAYIAAVLGALRACKAPPGSGPPQ